LHYRREEGVRIKEQWLEGLQKMKSNHIGILRTGK